VPTNKQRRDAARRHLERQLQRRQEREARRRKVTLISSVAGTLVLIAAVIITVVLLGSGSDNKPAAAGNSASGSSNPPSSAVSSSGAPSSSSNRSPLPSRSPAKAAAVTKKTSGPCGYSQTASKISANPNLFDVGLPPDPKPTPTANHTVVFQTNRGNITAVLHGKNAPCNVQSIVYLVKKKFYDNTACPRSVNSGIFVVQCGDPTATTGGGPTYTTKDENLSKADYSPGAIAMANSGPNTNGSQFFFITKNSNGALGKSYTVIGNVTKGLNILQAIAKAGDDGSNQAGGGRPNLDLIFKKVVVQS
jgi:peptidyl-prolyl cis-trans isomerase B (cyclophilin B)